jgi:hypothetical protein
MRPKPIRDLDCPGKNPNRVEASKRAWIRRHIVPLLKAPIERCVECPIGRSHPIRVAVRNSRCAKHALRNDRA